MQLLTSTKKSFSAKAQPVQWGHRKYNPIWAMLHKLRYAMGERDGKSQLIEIIKLGDGIFSTEAEPKQKVDPLKRGRISQKKSKVLVVAEIMPVENPGKPDSNHRKVNHLKTFVIPDLKVQTINLVVSKDVDKEVTIASYNSISYTNFKELVKRPKFLPLKEIGKLLSWVHIAISNAKRMLLGILHDIKPENQQRYLNEFCYEFNQRYFGHILFKRFLISV